MDCGAEYCPATFYFPPALALAYAGDWLRWCLPCLLVCEPRFKSGPVQSYKKHPRWGHFYNWGG